MQKIDNAGERGGERGRERDQRILRRGEDTKTRLLKRNTVGCRILCNQKIGFINNKTLPKLSLYARQSPKDFT